MCIEIYMYLKWGENSFICIEITMLKKKKKPLWNKCFSEGEVPFRGLFQNHSEGGHRPALLQKEVAYFLPTVFSHHDTDFLSPLVNLRVSFCLSPGSNVIPLRTNVRYETREHVCLTAAR